MENNSSLTEKIVGLMILVAVGIQTWTVVQEATEGDAGRQVAHWWRTKGRPIVVRVVTWLDARAVTERMFSEEIEPHLRGET